MKKSEFALPVATTPPGVRPPKPRLCSVGVSPDAKALLIELAEALAVAGLGVLPAELRSLANDEGAVNQGPFTNGVVVHLALRVLRERVEGWTRGTQATQATPRKAPRGGSDGDG